MKSRIDRFVTRQIRADLEKEAPAVRADAVEALAMLRDRRGLVRALGSGDPYLRCVAVRGLAREQGERIAWRLAHRIRDRDAMVRQHAAFALGLRIEWIARFALRRLIADPSVAVRCEAIAAYAAAALANVEDVLRAAAEGDPDAEVRALAADLLARRARTHVPTSSKRAAG